jgi:NADPH2:quinone reductase
VIVGSRGDIQITPRMLMAREADVRGLMLGLSSEAELAEIHAATAAGIEAGVLRPVIQQALPLAQAPAAHRAVMEAPSHGKIVLVP